MVNLNTIAELERLGFGSDICALETYVSTLQDAAADGEPIVSDEVYDNHFFLLKKLKPDSEVLNRNWEKEDNDYNEFDDLLKKYGMCSIETVIDYADLGKFKAVIDSVGHPVELVCGIKENGHGVRAVYTKGYLYNGSTRGRYKKGRDITRHLKARLPNYVEQWKDIDLVEIRGEIVVATEVFKEHLASTLKNELSSVTSLIRDSASDEEISMLNMVCYKVLSRNDQLKFEKISDEYDHLRECGFETPEKAIYTGVTSQNLQSSCETLLNYFEKMMDRGEIRYLSDGLVLSINDRELFYSLGKTKNAWNGNIALKMGRYWGSRVYSAEILQVVFKNGKSYLTPKAYVGGVKTANNASVDYVPLYNVGVMERYGYTTGKTVYFKYGGETGVTLTDKYGNSVSLT